MKNRTRFIKRNMSKITITLIAIVLSLALIVSTTYAWLVMSTNPNVTAIEVSIGGGNTILVANDINEDGIHYPGEFSDTINFIDFDYYQEIFDSTSLTPVSSSDGINWIFASYDENGKLLDYEDFTIDNTLSKANSSDGSYVCLDFWVVCPDSEYDLRLSMNSDTGQGTYLIELPSVTKIDSQYNLNYSNIVASSSRIGFLVNENNASEDSLDKYKNSSYYDNRFDNLQGIYNEVGEEVNNNLEYNYYIYEPNCDYHPNNSEYNNYYLVTNTLNVDKDNHIYVDYSGNNIFAQTKSTSTSFDELLEKLISESKDVEKSFYNELATLDYDVDCGQFIKYSNELVDKTNDYHLSGACEDQIIVSLKRNVPQRIRMFIYLEGQDADFNEVSYLNVYGISMSLQFAGSSHD